MGKTTTLDLSPEQGLHVSIMRSIAVELHDIPMVLKGGTALLLCYGLDRFSEDLDFDAPKKFNISHRIEKILSQHTKSFDLKIVKDTSTVQRIKAHYSGLASERLLKIETSFRGIPSSDQIEIINGIRTYSIETLIEQKINALEGRTAARDLYDVSFLVRHYFEKFSPASKRKLADLMIDVDAVEQRFKDAFEEDEILESDSLEGTILQIIERLN